MTASENTLRTGLLRMN